MEMDSTYYSPSDKDDHQYTDDEDDVQLPGFRFHPTDEELVDFYLRRKIQKKPISLELIKSIDIYKHDPWDLPKAAGDKEWYFFCKRGRKYKNSIRPNRVTGSGFWKATGIDRPIHSHRGEGHDCIGLKKTLVYYRGSAGKGSKTDWMMHEFRLPNPSSLNEYKNRSSNTKNMNTDPQQEAEIWTLCRIFKRNVSYKKYTPDWRYLSAAKRHPTDTVNSKSFTTDQKDHLDQSNTYISFGASDICYEEKKPVVNHTNNTNNIIDGSHHLHPHAVGQLSSNMQQPASTHPYMETFSNFSFQDLEDDLLNENWDELRSVVQQLAFDPTAFLV